MRAAAASPRLFGGAMASMMLHGGVIAAFLFLRAAPSPPAPPVYRVKLIAGPAGERAIGVVRPTPAAPPVVETPPPPAVTKPPPPPTKPLPAPPTPPPEPKKAVPAPKAKTTPVPKQATPTAPPKTREQPKPTPQPAAGGGPEGGKGADVATINTPGIEFPYPFYTANIARQIILAFGSSNTRFIAEIRFIIQRDGTVDPASINWVTRSGNYSFDSKAKSAIESVANARLFGPLPPGFREDILPVTFRFSPQLWR